MGWRRSANHWRPKDPHRSFADLTSKTHHQLINVLFPTHAASGHVAGSNTVFYIVRLRFFRIKGRSFAIMFKCVLDPPVATIADWC